MLIYSVHKGRQLMDGVAKLIILRGNSGIRREMLFVKDGPNPEASRLLLELALYGKNNCNIVILEGILISKWYKNLFEKLSYEFKDQILHITSIYLLKKL